MKDYLTAIDLANQAATHPETKGNPDVHVIIGQANMYLFKGDLTKISLAQESFDHFQTAIQKGGQNMRENLLTDLVLNANNERLSGGDLMYLQHILTKQGYVHFEAQEYDKAYPYFLLSANIVPDDIMVNFNAGYSAYGADLEDIAIEKFLKVIVLNEGLPKDQKFAYTYFTFNGLIDIYYAKRQDYDNALKYINMAQEAFPNEKLYNDYEFDVLINSEKMEEAIQSLKDVVAAGNATKGTFHKMAFLYYNNENFEEAVKAADQALGLDAEYYDALYVAGSVYYSQAIALLKAANNTVDDAGYQKLKKDARIKLSAALPYFEKAVILRPEDTYSLNPLSTIYDQLNMDEQRDNILARLAKLEGN